MSFFSIAKSVWSALVVVAEHTEKAIKPYNDARENLKDQSNKVLMDKMSNGNSSEQRVAEDILRQRKNNQG